MLEVSQRKVILRIEGLVASTTGSIRAGIRTGSIREVIEVLLSPGFKLSMAYTGIPRGINK